MTHDQMLAKLGTTETVFRAYLKKSSDFIKTLSPEELALHKRIHPPSLPAPFLDRNVKPEDISNLYANAPNLVGAFVADIENDAKKRSKPRHKTDAKHKKLSKG
jgi:hypothetical protein